MKKYLVFAGCDYYPSGGWGDFIGSYDVLQDALIKVIQFKNDWYHIVDRDTMNIVELDKVNK